MSKNPTNVFGITVVDRDRREIEREGRGGKERRVCVRERERERKGLCKRERERVKGETCERR